MAVILSARDELLLEQQCGQLRIEVLQGRNLVAKDSRGTSDPYVKVGLVAGPAGDFAGKPWRSSTVTHTLNPDWWETKKHVYIDERPEFLGSFIKIECWDYDKFSPDDFMGHAYVEVADLKAGEQQDVTVPMLSRPGKDDHVSGEIQLRVTYTPLEAYTVDVQHLKQLQSMADMSEEQVAALRAEAEALHRAQREEEAAEVAAREAQELERRERVEAGQVEIQSSFQLKTGYGIMSTESKWVGRMSLADGRSTEMRLWFSSCEGRVYWGSHSTFGQTYGNNVRLDESTEDGKLLFTLVDWYGVMAGHLLCGSGEQGPRILGSVYRRTQGIDAWSSESCVAGVASGVLEGEFKLELESGAA